MIISPQEIIDIVIMTLALGFIFSRIFERQSMRSDPFRIRKPFDFQSFKFAAMVTAPAVILHEFGHKFVALSFGINAVFHASYFGLAIGVALVLANFPFIFFIPGYVSYPNVSVTYMQNALIAIAGPLVNLILFGISYLLLKRAKNQKHIALLYLMKQINLFLFIFNMIPIPPFDGGSFFFNLIKAIF